MLAVKWQGEEGLLAIGKTSLLGGGNLFPMLGGNFTGASAVTVRLSDLQYV